MILMPSLDRHKGIAYQPWRFRWYVFTLLMWSTIIGVSYTYTAIEGMKFYQYISVGLSYTNHSF